MPHKTLRMIDGKDLRLQLPEPSHRESFFVFGAHKSGSTLLHNIFVDLCNTVKIPHVNYEGEIFRYGYSVKDVVTTDALFEQHGYGYIGFRTPHLLDHSTLDLYRTKNILLVRDPRDALTSHYFSLRYSHAIPDTGRASGKAEERTERPRVHFDR